MKDHIKITYGQKSLEALSQKITTKKYSSVFVLVDTHTEQYCLERFFENCPLEIDGVLTMNAGEENKNLSTCEYLWNELSDQGADRNSSLINLGGGVVTE